MSPGFHVVPSAAYHQDPCASPSLSSSIAQVLLRESPRKAWFSHPRLNPSFKEAHSDTFDLGSAAHAALLEGSAGIEVIDPADFPSKTGSIPDGWTNNAIRAARDAARQTGKTPLLKRHYESVQEMVGIAREFLASSEIADYWFNAESEVTGIWLEGNPQTWMRCRFDRITMTRKFIMDYKTTDSSVEPEQFSRFLTRMGYHLQDAFYRRGVRALGVDTPKFVFLAQSCNPPYECSLHACDPALQEIADAEVERAIGIWRQCITKDRWPSYGGRIHYAMPSNFMMSEHEIRLQEAA